jgi:hypothetical protein
MKDSDRRGRLLNLWLLRPSGKRTENDLVSFYGALERLHPNLLKRTGGDAYRNLKSDLRGYIEEPKG